MVSHKIKQINAPLRFTNTVLVCLIEVININSEQKSACTFTDKKNYAIINQNRQNNIPLNARSWNDLKRSLDGSLKKFLKIRWYEQLEWGFYTIRKIQNFREAIQPCIVYWGTTNLKDKYAPNKTVIKIFMSLGQSCCTQQT